MRGRTNRRRASGRTNRLTEDRIRSGVTTIEMLDARCRNANRTCRITGLMCSPRSVGKAAMQSARALRCLPIHFQIVASSGKPRIQLQRVFRRKRRFANRPQARRSPLANVSWLKWSRTHTCATQTVLAKSRAIVRADSSASASATGRVAGVMRPSAIITVTFASNQGR